MPLMSTLGGLRGSPTIPYTTLPTGLGFYTIAGSASQFAFYDKTLLIDTSDNMYLGSQGRMTKLSNYNGASTWAKQGIYASLGRGGFTGVSTGNLLAANDYTPSGTTSYWTIDKLDSSNGSVLRSRYISTTGIDATCQQSVADGLGNIYIAGIHTDIATSQNKVAIAKIEDGTTNFNLLTLRTLPYIAPSGSQIVSVLDLNIDVSTGYVYMLLKDNSNKFVLMKLTPSSLSVVWAKYYVSPSTSTTSYGSIVSDGVNVYMCLSSTSWFSYVYVINMSTGDIVTQKSISGSVYAHYLDVDGYGNLYVACNYTSGAGQQSTKLVKFDNSLNTTNVMNFTATNSGSNTVWICHGIKYYNGSIYMMGDTTDPTLLKIPDTLDIIGSGKYTASTNTVTQESSTVTTSAGSHTATTYSSTTWTTVSGTITFLGDTASTSTAWTNTLL